MSDILKGLLRKFDGLTEQQIIEQTKALYVSTYCQQSVALHDGKKLTFAADQFDHAFHDKDDEKKLTTTIKSVFSVARAARIDWIREIVAGKISNVQCYLVPPQPGNPVGRRQRLYTFWTEPYMVWMFEYDSYCEFSTAYPSFAKRMREKIKLNKGKMVWWK